MSKSFRKWDPVPIEYKHGAPKENNADELQLYAQAICLEEMFQTGFMKIKNKSTCK